MSKLHSAIRFAGNLLEPVEKLIYRSKHIGNMCQHFVANGNQDNCRGCFDLTYDYEMFFDYHLGGQRELHTDCEECAHVLKLKGGLHKVCCHLVNKTEYCTDCVNAEWRKTQSPGG
jgi:hypothetical protein